MATDPQTSQSPPTQPSTSSPATETTPAPAPTTAAPLDVEAPSKSTEDLNPAASPSEVGSVMEGLDELLREDEDVVVETPPVPAAAPKPAEATPAPATPPAKPAVPPVAPVPPKPAPVVPPVAPAAAAPQPTPTPPAPVAAPTPPVVAPVVQPEAPPVPAKTPEQERAEWNERRKSFIAQLTDQYKVPDEQVALLEAEPAKYLPQLAATLHANVLEAAVNGIMAELPRMWAGFQAAEKRYAAAETAFYEKWPELNKPEYGPVVTSFATTYRQLNPKATDKQVIDQVGIMAMTHLGLAGQVPLAVPVGVPQPASPPSPVPIVPGGGAPLMPQKQTPNPWEELSREDMD